MKTIFKSGLLLATLLSVGLALSGCASKTLGQTFSSEEDRTLCATVISDLQAGEAGDADIVGRLSPQLQPKFIKILPQLHAMTPKGPGASSHLVEASFTNVANTSGQHWRDAYLAYEVDQGQQRALIRIEIIRQGGSAVINSLYINQLYVPAEQLNAFSLSGKSSTQYAFILLAFASFVTIVISEAALFRTPGIRRKWLWAIGCLFGYGQLWVNWSNGGVSFQLINFQLLGAFALKGGLLAPWRIGFGLPLVSVIFLIRRKSLQNRATDLNLKKATDAF